MNTGRLTPRRRRALGWASGLLAAFAIAGFFVAPPVIKAQLERRLTAALGRTVTVGKVKVNPFALSLTLEDFDVRLKEGDGSFLGWKRLYVNFDALASLTGSWVLGAIELDGAHAAVILKPDGSLNFSDILARATAAPAAVPAAPARPARPLRIGRLAVSGARVEFADQSRPKPFATVLGPVSFVLTEFHTAGAQGAPYRFEAVTEAGEKLTWAGTLQAAPFRSAGELRLEQIVLPKYAAYYVDRVPAELLDGRLSVRGRYDVSLDAAARRLRLTEGALELQGVRLAERPGGEAVVELPRFSITGVEVDALAPKVAIAAIGGEGGRLQIRRDPDGGLNLVKMFLPPAGPSASAPASAPAPRPQVTVGEIYLKQLQVGLEDRAAPRPAQLGLADLNFSLKDFTLADGATMPLQLDCGWAPKGRVRVAGGVVLQPAWRAEVKADVADLELLPLSP
ncbi:MAG: DUF748 domain-containing protein, partial [Opitutaceae bacterium]|nr:DUF748 domain-containing protein [Opitutaceae bacterium]